MSGGVGGGGTQSAPDPIVGSNRIKSNGRTRFKGRPRGTAPTWQTHVPGRIVSFNIMEKQILICAGEPSGDALGAGVIRSLLSMDGALHIRGLGGRMMATAGAELDYLFDGRSAMGLSELASDTGFWLKTWAGLSASCMRQRPDVAILVDFPEFNMALARVLKAFDVPVIWYVSPQVWAWRAGRVKTLGRLCERIALILPFEEELYHSAGVRHAEYVGHPLMDMKIPSRTEARRMLDIDKGKRVIAMLPGSRHHEIGSHLETLVSAGSELGEKYGALILLPVAPGLNSQSTDYIRQSTAPCFRLVNTNDSSASVSALAAADAALVCSGTATLTAALCRTPFAAFYKAGDLTYLAGRLFIKSRYLALPNIIMNTRTVPELLQQAFTAEKLVSACESLFDPGIRAFQKDSFAQLEKILKKPGAAKRVATMILETVR